MASTKGGPRHYEVLGRVMWALSVRSGPQIMCCAEDFDIYQTISGGFTLTWKRGPHVHEVIKELLDLAEDPELACFTPGDVVISDNTDGSGLQLEICGEPISFRVSETIGQERAFRDAVAGVS